MINVCLRSDHDGLRAEEDGQIRITRRNNGFSRLAEEPRGQLPSQREGGQSELVPHAAVPTVRTQ